MPFWGLRRSLVRAARWEDWLGALDAALAVRPPGPARASGEVELGVPEGAASELRAAQWLEQGQLLEERLGRPDEAAASYRAGLRETPRHGGLLLALFWTACALPDGWMRAEALEGMLRRRLPWAKRAALTVVAVRSRRGGSARPGLGDAAPRSEDNPPRSPEPGDHATGPAGKADSGAVRDRPGARRALLMRTLALAGSPDVRPLLEELAREACATEELLVRAIAMTDLAARLPAADDRLAAAVLRHASGLYRRHAHHVLLHPPERGGADDAAIAEATLQTAWRRNPGSPLIAAELAALFGARGAGTEDGQVRRGDRLAELLGHPDAPDAPAAPGDGERTGAGTGGLPSAGASTGGSEAEVELEVAWLGACLASDARAEASPVASPAASLDRGLALAAPLRYLDRHRQFGRARVDELALVVAVRARAGDRAGLARAFGQVAEILGAASGRDAGRPGRRVRAPRPEAPGSSASSAIPRAHDTGAHPPTLTARRGRAPEATAEAHAWVVAATLWETLDGPEPGVEAERCWRRALAASADWDAVAWDHLDRLMRRQQRWSELAELLANRLDAMGGDTTAGEALVARTGWLEQLVRVHRDRLADPESAARHHEHLASRATDPVRHLVRRWDLELALVEKGRPSALATRIDLLSALGAAAPGPGLAAALWCDAGELVLRGGPGAVLTPAARAQAARAFHTGLAEDRHGRAGSGLEQLALDPGDRAAAIEEELTRGFAAGAADPLADLRRRALAFRLAFHHQRARHPDQARLALGRIFGTTGVAQTPRPSSRELGAEELGPQAGTPEAPATDELARIARVLDDQLARGGRQPALAPPGVKAEPMPAGRRAGSSTPLAVPSDRAEALERAGALEAAEAAFRQLVREDGSIEVALGWLRVAAALRDPALTREATSVLADRLEAPERRWMQREQRLLAILDQRDGADRPDEPKLVPAEGEVASRPLRKDAPVDALLDWAEGIRSRDPSRAASGLVVVAEQVGADANADRDGLLLRAALRARLGGDAVSSAVHAQVPGLSPSLVLGPDPSVPRGSASAVSPPAAVAGHAAASLAEAFTCSLADLPVAGRAERIAARRRRADRTGGALAYALELECGYDAEARGDAGAALDGFARALARDGEGIEALDGLRRIAAARGDARGAAAAGLRLAAVLRDPLHAAAELERAGRLLEEHGRVKDATATYWQALARNPRAELAYARLAELLAAPGTPAGPSPPAAEVTDGPAEGDRAETDQALERLHSLRLSVEHAPDGRVRVLLARALHRARPGGDPRGAIQDLQRILALEPTHVPALAQLMELARGAGAVTHAMAYAQALLGCVREPETQVELRLKLAAMQVSAGQREQARATLRESARAAPHARLAWERLTALALEDGNRQEALEALQGWVGAVDDPRERARLWMHIGAVQRALARASAESNDSPPEATSRGAISSAVAAFKTAVALGIGSPGHAALAGALAEAGAWAERAQWLADTIDVAMGRVRDDPTDVAGVEELHVLFELAGQPPGNSPGIFPDLPDGPHTEGEGASPLPPATARDARRAQNGARITAQLLVLLGAGPPRGRHRGSEELPALPSSLPLAGTETAVGEAKPESRPDAAPAGWRALSAARFIGELVPPLASQPGRQSVAASIWAELAPSAEALLGPRAAPPELGARAAVSTALHPEIAWIERTAVALGLPTLRVSIARGGAGGPAVALDGPRPELCLPADIFERAREPVVRFGVARVLGLLREHAVCFDAVEDAEVDVLLRSAVALVSGGATASAEPVSPSTEPAGRDDRDDEAVARAVKVLGRALPRKARKALIAIVTGEQAGAREQAREVDGFRARVLELADRVGLAVGGDLRAAIAASAPADVSVDPDVSSVLGARARALVRFALTDAFLLAARETEDVTSPTSFGPAMEF
jgi:tetratricopeptide (TPR) repeat protein